MPSSISGFSLAGKRRVHVLIKQITSTYRNHFSRSNENRSIDEYCCFKSVPYHQVRSGHETLGYKAGQGSHGSLKTWKVMKFKNLFSRPRKSKNLIVGPGKSWKIYVVF